MNTASKQVTSSFGICVKKRLVELGLTQRHLAKEIGVNENYLTDILRGRKTGKKYRESICHFLGMDYPTETEKQN